MAQGADLVRAMPDGLDTAVAQGGTSVHGVDTATISRADLRSGVGMVRQDTWLLGGTVVADIAWNQLMPIARAFLAGPSLLILDEATSPVDTRAEVLVQRAMAALRSDRTRFLIAHRLSTGRDADRVLVGEAGALVEQGTHEQLLGVHGASWRLDDAQFAGAST